MHKKKGDAVPRDVDAQSRVGLLPTSLVDAARSFHHFLHRFVVAEFEFVHHLLAILNNSDLSDETQRKSVTINNCSRFLRFSKLKGYISCSSVIVAYKKNTFYEHILLYKLSIQHEHYQNISFLLFVRLPLLTHLYLTWSNIELLKNVDEKSLHFIPGVDGV